MILGVPMISYARPPSIALCLQQPPRALVIYPWTTSSGFSSPRLFQRSCNREDHFVKVQMPLWGYQLSFSYHLSPTISHIKECTSPTVTTVVITLQMNISTHICETWADSWMSMYLNDFQFSMRFIFSPVHAKRHGSATSRVCLANQSCNHQRRWRRVPTPYNHRCLSKGVDWLVVPMFVEGVCVDPSARNSMAAWPVNLQLGGQKTT